MELADIFENNRKWVKEKLAEDSNFFKRLAEGQSPQILYIGCSDSRVSAEEIMGLSPGQMFVHRNIANIVSNLDLSVMSGIKFAVDYLKVAHIIVCGHYSCGGVKEAMMSHNLGILNPWLRSICDVYRFYQKELDEIIDEEKRYRRLVELNVKEQCINVIKVESVQKAYYERKLKIHGWVFDFQTGLLSNLKINFDKILAEIMKIYHLE